MLAISSGLIPAIGAGQLRAGDESASWCPNELLNQHLSLSRVDITCKGYTSLRNSGFRTLSTSRQNARQNAALKHRICANAVLDVSSGPGPAGDSKSGSVKTPPVAAVGSDVGFSGYMTAEERVFEAVVKEAAKVERVSLADVRPDTPISTPELMLEAYDRCGEVCGEYAKTFYLGGRGFRH